MTTKQKKTKAELTFLVMLEIRRHLEYDHILNVAITRPPQRASHHPNWGFAWIVDGKAIAPEGAAKIAPGLQAQFDLI